MAIDRYERAVRAQRAMSSFRIKFARVNRGRDVFHAHIYIDGAFWGYISQRRGGEYEAYRPNNRLIAAAPSLSELRERVGRHYADPPSSHGVAS